MTAILLVFLEQSRSRSEPLRQCSRSAEKRLDAQHRSGAGNRGKPRPLMKLNLHSHLEGRLRPSTAAALAAEAGVAPPEGGWERALQLDGPANLTVYLSKVAATYPFFRSPAHVARIACEAVEDAAADGTDYSGASASRPCDARAHGIRPGLGDVRRLRRNPRRNESYSKFKCRCGDCGPAASRCGNEHRSRAGGSAICGQRTCGIRSGR